MQGDIGIDLSTVDDLSGATPAYGQILHARPTGNTIRNFVTAMTSPLPFEPNITGVFAPNRVR